jgi:polyisoprenoid-binding protein YceI
MFRGEQRRAGGLVMFAFAQALFAGTGLPQCGMAGSLPQSLQRSEEKEMKFIAPALVAAVLAAAPAFAEPVKYDIDTTHAQIVFSYNHLGFSTTTGMFGGITGTILFDQEDPGASSVEVSFPVKSMFTGFAERDGHFMSKDFFDAADDEVVTFKSTAIEVTGETTARITGELVLNGVTKEVVLDTVLNQVGEHPMMKQQWAGFSATTTLVRSEFGLGLYAPFIGDDVSIAISLEAGKAAE